jgi:hypothetical protein
MTNNYRTGRKSKAKTATEADFVAYRRARADREASLAKLAELEWNRRAARYVPRADVVAGNAAALALIERHLSAIPAAAARRLAVPPAVVEEMAAQIADALHGLADAMVVFERTPNESTT